MLGGSLTRVFADVFSEIQVVTKAIGSWSLTKRSAKCSHSSAEDVSCCNYTLHTQPVFMGLDLDLDMYGSN